MHRRRLPLAYSCPVSLATMPRRSEAEHWCSSCERSVIDLSAMSETSARAVLDAAADTSICIHYKVDRAGQVVFADRPTEPQRRATLALASLALAVTLGLGGCARSQPAELELPGDRMGGFWTGSPTMSAVVFGDVGVVVVDRFSGEPIPDVVVHVRSSSVDFDDLTTDEGTQEFDGLMPDTYAVEIVAGLAEATEWIHLQAGTRLEVTFRIDPTTASRFVHPLFPLAEPVEEHENGLMEPVSREDKRQSRRHRR